MNESQNKRVVHIEHNKGMFSVQKSFNGVIEGSPYSHLNLTGDAYRKDFHEFVKEWLEEGYTIEIK